MNPGNERRSQAAQQAAEWVVKLDSGAMTVAERADFVDWLRESPLHVAEMLRLGAIQDSLADFSSWDKLSGAKAPVGHDALDNKVVLLPVRQLEYPAMVPVRQQRYRRVATLAASLLVAAVMIGVMVRQPTERIATASGERRELRLSDGSLLEIAPETELSLRMERNQRLVLLARGEALFHVAKDASRPFIVQAGETRVRAVGTAFSVDRALDSVVVTVAEGRVAVTTGDESDQPQAHTQIKRQLYLGADQQVAIAANGVAAAVLSVNSKTELAWARGLLIIDGNSVSEVVRRFNLANRLQIRVLDERLADRQISGVFDTSDPQSFVAFLESVAGVRVMRSNADEIIVGASLVDSK